MAEYSGELLQILQVGFIYSAGELHNKNIDGFG